MCNWYALQGTRAHPYAENGRGNDIEFCKFSRKTWVELTSIAKNATKTDPNHPKVTKPRLQNTKPPSLPAAARAIDLSAKNLENLGLGSKDS